MKKFFLFGLVLCYQLTSIVAQNKEVPPTFILLRNAYIVDGISEKARKGDILIKNQRIEKINYQKNIAPPKGAVLYDLTDNFIIPGLIDAHIHFGTDPSGFDNLEDTKKRLHYLLKNGITSVRDMAGDTRFLGYLARQAALNEISAPNIYYSALMAGATFFDDPRTHSSAKGATPGKCAWMQAVDLHTNMQIAVAQAKGTNASGIKVYADLEAEVIEKIVEAAHQQGIKVWSHAAVFPAKPQAIVDAGVDVVSHSTLLAWEGVDYLPSSAKGRYVKQVNFNIQQPVFQKLVQTMKARGTILDATLATYQHSRFDSTIFLQGVELTKLAHQHGVKIGVGTDRSVHELPLIAPLFQEMQILVQQVGMSPYEVLQAATIINAEMVGKANEIGSIIIGKKADLVVLEKNPLEDIKAINSTKYVFKNGELMAN